MFKRPDGSYPEGPLDGQATQSVGSAVDVPPPPGDIPLAPEGNGQVLGERIPVLNLTSDCVAGELFSVTLGLDLIAEDEGFPVVDDPVYSAVRAVLRWGSGDAQFEAEVDWQNGTQLSISAENMRIDARYVKATNPFDPASDPAFPTYRVNASLSYGNVGRNSNPARLTELVQLAAVDDVALIEIPKFAISYTVLSEVPFSTRQIGYSTVYGPQYSKATLEANTAVATENIMPLANGSRFIQITNINEGFAAMYVVFGLSL